MVKCVPAMKDAWAHDFECDRPMAWILATLNASGPWTWVTRDKDAFGPYISCAPFQGLQARIYDLDGWDSNGPKYTADFMMRDDCGTERALIEGVFLGMLGRLPARNVTRGEYYD